MAVATKIPNAVAIALADFYDTLVNAGTTDANGHIAIYADDGSPAVPVQADDTIGGATLLATVELQDPAHGAAADGTPGGVITILGVPLSDLSIDATGTARFYRMFNRDNVIVKQGEVGVVSGFDMIVNSVAFQLGATFDILSFTNTFPEE